MVVSVMLLSFYLIGMVYGAVALRRYKQTSELGLIALGVPLYLGADLVLTKS